MSLAGAALNLPVISPFSAAAGRRNVVSVVLSVVLFGSMLSGLVGCGGANLESAPAKALAATNAGQSLTAPAVQDSYDHVANVLSIPYVNVGQDTYHDVRVQVGQVLEVAGGPAPVGVDVFDPLTNVLSIPSVLAYGQTYTRVKVRVGPVLAAAGPLSKDSVWQEGADGQRWLGTSLEAVDADCRNRSIRWIAPISGFDVNKDGVSDFVMPISCYVGPDPAPGEKHNRPVRAAWKMFCSQPGGAGHVDCTRERFGTDTINATATGSGGGNPYVHVMERPADINNDGYPDFWYALNRDDGRPGFDFNNPQDVALLQQFCGPRTDFDWDCTRKATQTVLLSRPDGRYRVVPLPWGPTNTQAMVMLPNTQGSVDAFSFNYGRWRAARLVGETFVDVTQEYQSYSNVDLVGYSSPYVRVVQSAGQTYLVGAGVPKDRVPANVREQMDHWGFSLWRWVPGKGFELSDTHMPKAADVFSYRQASGSSWVARVGAYIRGIPVFSPRWHFFRMATLSTQEGPVLVVGQEAGTTAGRFFKAPVDAAARYDWYAYDSPDHRYRITELSVVQGFLIRDGKLIEREKSVVEGDVVWNTPDLLFEDLNADGHVDAVRVSGHAQQGGVFLNNGQGTLQKLSLKRVVPSFTNRDPAYVGGFGWTVRNLGTAPRLGLIWWGTGFPVLPDWAGTRYTVPDMGLMQGRVPIHALPVHSPQTLQIELQACLEAMVWIDQCELY